MKWLGPTWLAVDLSAIAANLSTIRSLTKAKVCPVLKADAYGHGIAVVSLFLEQQQVPYIAVSDIYEAAELRQAGVNIPVLVLTPILPEQASSAAAHDLTITVSDPKVIEALAEQALTHRRTIKIHLKVNTGMNRVGIPPALALEYARQIAKHKYLELEGVYTHFAEANSDLSFTKTQLNRLLAVKEELEHSGFTQLIWHAANSSALFTFPESHLDLVRVGTALFGQSLAKLPPGIALQNTWNLYTRIIQVHQVAKGEPVGYNQAYIAKRDSLIGVIPIGYSDGLGLAPENHSLRQYLRKTLIHLVHNPLQVSVDGISCPIVGKIAMGMCCIDLTDHPRAPDLYGAVVNIKARRTAVNRRIPKIYTINNKLVLIHWQERYWQPMSRDGLVYVKEISLRAAVEILKRRNLYGS